MEGYRTKKRIEQRKKRQKLVRSIGVPALVFVLVITGLLIIFRLSNNKSDDSLSENKNITRDVKTPEKKSSDKPAKTVSVAGNKSNEPQKDVEIVGLLIGGNKSSEDSIYHAILIINNKQKKALILSIPDDTVLNISGQTFDKIKTAVRLDGAKAYLTAISGLGVKIENYVHANADFGDVTPGNISDMFLKAKDSNLTSKERLSYSQTVKGQVDVSKSYLPVREVRSGTETISQPVVEEVKELLSGQSVEVKEASQPSVLVLNGNGTPGLGSLIALKLIKNGFTVVDTRNAKNAQGKDDFSRPKTLIYSSIDNKQAVDNLVSIIGTGELVAGKSEKVAQITLILGKDFKKPE